MLQSVWVNVAPSWSRVQPSLLLVCPSCRNLMYGRCTRSAAGNSSLLATVSGNSMRISSTDQIFWSIRLSFFLQPWVLYPSSLLFSSLCLAVTPVEPALTSSRFYTQLVPSVQEELHTQLPLQTSLFLQAVPSPDSPTATLPELPVHFFGMLCK